MSNPKAILFVNHAHVAERVAQRPPGYAAELGVCVVHRDERGIYVDADSAAWQALVAKYKPATAAAMKQFLDASGVKPPPKPSPWSLVKHTWEAASSYMKSRASAGLAGTTRVDPATRALRVLSCHGSPPETPPCPSRAYSPDKRFHYCNDCGCGERDVARLDAPGSAADAPTFDAAAYDKLDFPVLECPRKRPGFSNAPSPAA